MATKRSKGPKWTWLRFRKNDHAHNLMVAAQRYIHAKGGSALVLGGIEVQDWGEGLGKYKIAVCAMGTAPKFEKAGRQLQERGEGT